MHWRQNLGTSGAHGTWKMADVVEGNFEAKEARIFLSTPFREEGLLRNNTVTPLHGQSGTGEVHVAHGF